MFISELLFALIIAFIFTLVLRFLGIAGGISFFLFFIILLLVTWAGGIWVTPLGPIWWGVPWLTFLLVGFLITLVIVSLIPGHRRKKIRNRENGPETLPTVETVIAADIFFWILIISLFAVLIIGYIIR